MGESSVRGRSGGRASRSTVDDAAGVGCWTTGTGLPAGAGATWPSSSRDMRSWSWSRSSPASLSWLRTEANSARKSCPASSPGAAAEVSEAGAPESVNLPPHPMQKELSAWLSRRQLGQVIPLDIRSCPLPDSGLVARLYHPSSPHARTQSDGFGNLAGPMDPDQWTIEQAG